MYPVIFIELHARLLPQCKTQNEKLGMTVGAMVRPLMLTFASCTLHFAISVQTFARMCHVMKRKCPGSQNAVALLWPGVTASEKRLFNSTINSIKRQGITPLNGCSDTKRVRVYEGGLRRRNHERECRSGGLTPFMHANHDATLYKDRHNVRKYAVYILTLGVKTNGIHQAIGSEIIPVTD